MTRTHLAAAVVTVLAMSASVAGAETWKVDPTHTDVRASWLHSGFSIQSLQFREFDGSLEFTPGDIVGAKADFTLPVSSIETGIEMFDTDLKGANFFDAETYPTVRFVSTGIEQTGENTAIVSGDLTIRDVTKPATFDVTVNQIGEHPVAQFLDAWKGQWIGMTATSRIVRSEWGLGAFIPVGSDEIEIVINAEMQAQ